MVFAWTALDRCTSGSLCARARGGFQRFISGTWLGDPFLVTVARLDRQLSGGEGGPLLKSLELSSVGPVVFIHNRVGLNMERIDCKG